MKIDKFHPYGRFLKALRIIDRIQDYKHATGDYYTEFDYTEILTALKSPRRPEAVKILKPFFEEESSWPSPETCEMVADLLPKWNVQMKD